MNGLARRQRGIVAVAVAISLLALLAMVGFALDSGHLILNKSRLQNTVDAAALSAAKVLDDTESEDQATAAARAVFDEIIYNSEKVQVLVECSLEEMGDLHTFIEKLKKNLQPNEKLISFFALEGMGCGEDVK